MPRTLKHPVGEGPLVLLLLLVVVPPRFPFNAAFLLVSAFARDHRAEKEEE